MSIKTTKRIVLGVIASLVFAPFAVIAPASADITEFSVASAAVDEGIISVSVTHDDDADPGAGQGEIYIEVLQSPDDAIPVEFITNDNVAGIVDETDNLSVTTFTFAQVTTEGTYRFRVWVDQDADAAFSAGVDTPAQVVSIVLDDEDVEVLSLMQDIDAELVNNTPIYLDAPGIQDDGIDILLTGVIGEEGLVNDEEVYVKVTFTPAEDSDLVAVDDMSFGLDDATLDEDVFDGETEVGEEQVLFLTLVVDDSHDAEESVRMGTLNFIPDADGEYIVKVELTNDAFDSTGISSTLRIDVLDGNGVALNEGAFSITNDEEEVVVGQDSVTYFDVNEEGTTNFVEFVYRIGEIDDFDLEFDDTDRYNYSVTEEENLRFTISGPAVWGLDDSDGDNNLAKRSFDRTRTVMTFSLSDDDGDSILHGEDLDIEINDKTGTVKITVASVDTTSGVATTIGTYTIEIVSSSKSGTYSAADSFARLQLSDDALDEMPTRKVDETGASTRPNNGTAYLAMYLRDIYDGPVTTPNTALIATASNGALVAWGIAPTSGTSVETTNLSNPVLWIRQGTATTTTVEVKLNDVVVATKTVSWTGAASTIAISGKKVSVPVSAATAAFKYALSDAAGNRVTGTVTAEVDGVYILDAEVASSSATAARDVTVTCSALRGKGSVTLTYATTKTETVEVICAGGIASFEVTTSKSAFERSEIGVLTITAKDAAGNPVPDGTALASAAGKIQFTGAGASLAKSPAATDTFTDGKIDYAFTTSATAGSYSFALWHADLSPAVTKIAQFTVNAPAVAPTYTTPTLTASLEGGRVLLFGACAADEGDMIIYVKSPGKAWNEKAKTLECVAGEFEGSIKAPKTTKYFRVKQEGTGLWSPSVLVRR